MMIANRLSAAFTPHLLPVLFQRHTAFPHPIDPLFTFVENRQREVLTESGHLNTGIAIVVFTMWQ